MWVAQGCLHLLGQRLGGQVDLGPRQVAGKDDPAGHPVGHVAGFALVPDKQDSGREGHSLTAPKTGSQDWLAFPPDSHEGSPQPLDSKKTGKEGKEPQTPAAPLSQAHTYPSWPLSARTWLSSSLQAANTCNWIPLLRQSQITSRALYGV